MSHYTQDAKSYPCIKLTLCDFVLEVLTEEAKANHHTIQEEINRRLRATFLNEIEYRVRLIELKQAQIAFSNPKKYSFITNRDMVDLLAASAIANKHPLDEEVLFRLLVSFANPTEMNLTNYCNALIHRYIKNEEKDRQIIASMAASVRFYEAHQQ